MEDSILDRGGVAGGAVLSYRINDGGGVAGGAGLVEYGMDDGGGVAGGGAPVSHARDSHCFSSFASIHRSRDTVLR